MTLDRTHSKSPPPQYTHMTTHLYKCRLAESQIGTNQPQRQGHPSIKDKISFPTIEVFHCIVIIIPQALSSTFTVLRTLQPRTFRTLQPRTFRTLQPRTFRTLQPRTFRTLQPRTFRTLQPRTFRTLDLQDTTFRTLQPRTFRTLQPRTFRTLQPKTFRTLQHRTIRF